MVVDASLVNLAKASYGRCLMKPSFWDDFYDVFLASSDKISKMFANTDMAKQKVVLKGSLNFAMTYAADESNAFAKNKLEQVGGVHSKENVNVAPSMYTLWVESLVKAVEKNDSEYTAEVGDAWRKVVTPTIELLKTKY